MAGEIFSMILALIGTVCVLIMTYYASRWYAKKMGPIAGGKYIKIIDRVTLGKGGAVILVELQGKQFMMGVSDQNVQILKELDEKIEPAIEQGAGKESFQSILTSLNKWKGSK